ncbi:BQ5605_C018g08756 [Microbotryum silenes-dioicae]|uniref:BQ5605_C018g08756 protein n=1 Tax=Microbotryum silenes-dioicae TaxID=796604 RepID=A0A2X0P0K0_9BASI|nr:BQ5605_C018g08756 [Microbotryum silenes-dioicae]
MSHSRRSPYPVSEIKLGDGETVAPPPGGAGRAGRAVGPGGLVGAGTGGPGASASALGAADAASLFRSRTLHEFPGGSIGLPQEVFQFLQRHHVPQPCQLISAYTDSPVTVSSEFLGIVCGSTFLDHAPIRPRHEFNSDAFTRSSSGALYHKSSNRR